jgi:Tfp pilus assembly protein PilZ
MKRTRDRAKKRVMVRYGVDEPSRTGFTTNISPTGMQIQTNQVFKPGTTIHIEVRFSDRSFHLRARVVWAKKATPMLAQIVPSGMGVQFLDPGPEWTEYIAGWN